MKIWKITSCNMCPKIGSIYDINGSYDYCYKEHKKIINADKLPFWCTLDDYKEESIKND